MVAVNMTTGKVDPGLFVLLGGYAAQGTTAALHAGKGQCVKAHGALGPGCIQFLPQGLQVLLCGGVEKAVSGAPEQCCSTKVNQRAVLQNVTFTLHLRGT